MNVSLRTGIAAVAGTVALGTLGFAAAANADGNDSPALKREDTSSAVLQDVDLDDLDGPDPRAGQGVDDPTNNTVQTRNTAPTRNTVQTRNTAPTANTAQTRNTAPTANTAQTKNTAPTKNTVKTVNTAPTKNTAPTSNTAPTGPTSDTN